MEVITGRGVTYEIGCNAPTARKVNYVVKGGKLWKDGEKVPGSATGEWVGVGIWVSGRGVVRGECSRCRMATTMLTYT